MIAPEEIQRSLSEYALLLQEQRRTFLNAHLELVDPEVVAYSLTQANRLQNEKIRQFSPDPSDVQSFHSLAQGAYALATQLQDHASSAQAAGMLAVFEDRFGSKIDREFWLITQSVHTVLTYPTPKFSSTFDHIISSTSFVIGLHGRYDPLSVTGLIQQTCDLLISYVGNQAIDECIKFLRIPHDPYSVVTSLIYLAHLHLNNCEASKALPAIQQLVQTEPDSELVTAAASLPVYLIETYPNSLDFSSPARAALLELIGPVGKFDAIPSLEQYRLFVMEATGALFRLWSDSTRT